MLRFALMPSRPAKLCLLTLLALLALLITGEAMALPASPTFALQNTFQEAQSFRIEARQRVRDHRCYRIHHKRPKC